MKKYIFAFLVILYFSCSPKVVYYGSSSNLYGLLSSSGGLVISEEKNNYFYFDIFASQFEPLEGGNDKAMAEIEGNLFQFMSVPILKNKFPNEPKKTLIDHMEYETHYISKGYNSKLKNEYKFLENLNGNPVLMWSFNVPEKIIQKYAKDGGSPIKKYYFITTLNNNNIIVINVVISDLANEDQALFYLENIMYTLQVSDKPFEFDYKPLNE